MICELEDTSKVKALFDGWRDSVIYSCLQKTMGKIFVTDLNEPKSALAYAGHFGFFAGLPDRELVDNKPKGPATFIPQNAAWATLIEESCPDANKVTRYAIKKDTRFDRDALRKNLTSLPPQYALKAIDGELYDKCLENSGTAHFVASFSDKEAFLKHGKGFVVVKNGKIVSGASSYSYYNEGIEITVSTVETERRKRLALIACSALILKCLDEGLYPNWDARNMNSVRLSEKLGYEFDKEYVAYEVGK